MKTDLIQFKSTGRNIPVNMWLRATLHEQRHKDQNGINIYNTITSVSENISLSSGNYISSRRG